MHHFKIGYSDFVIDDEYAEHLYKVMAHMKPVDTEGYGDDMRLFRSHGRIDMEVANIDCSVADLPLKQQDPPPSKGKEKEDISF